MEGKTPKHDVRWGKHEIDLEQTPQGRRNFLFLNNFFSINFNKIS